MAWSPCGLVLAVAVHGREKPAIAAEGPVEGLSSIQLWRVDLGKNPAAQLRVGPLYMKAHLHLSHHFSNDSEPCIPVQ